MVVFIIRNELVNVKQSDWLKEYIDSNREKRKKGVYSFKKDFPKLMNNCVYGKTMENFKKGVNVRPFNDYKYYKKYASRPNFISQKIFGKIFVAIHEIKQVLTLDKPI